MDLRPVDTMLIRTPSTTGEPHRCNVFAVSLGLADPDIELHLPSVEGIECLFEAEEGSGLMQVRVLRGILAEAQG